MEDNKLTYIDENGNEVLCEVLFTFESEEFGKKYVLFYEVGDMEDGDDQVSVMAASYKEGEDGSIGELYAVETDEEWDLIEEMLQRFDDEECGCDDCDCENCEEDCHDEHCNCHHHHE